MNKILHWITFGLLFIWQLPQNLVALFLMCWIAPVQLISYDKYCFLFKSKNMLGGISLGNFAFVSNLNAKSSSVKAHEIGHTYDSKRFGPLYLFIVGIPSFCWATFRNREKYPNYYDFYTERWANKHAGLIVRKTAGGRYYITF